MLTRNKLKIDKDNLHSATSLVNYIRNDGIIDYFDIVKKNDYMIDTSDEFKLKKRKISETDFDNIKSTDNKSLQVKHCNKCKQSCTCSFNLNHEKKKFNPKTSFDYIVENGHIFEKMIVQQIISKMDINKENTKYIEIKEDDFYLKYNSTLQVLKSKKYDIITGAILINKTNNTYGYPDIIVSGYWIKKYIEECPENISYLHDSYYIIDIKSSTINLINGGSNVSSGLLFDGYKAQIYVYVQALNDMLKTNTTIGFILGKRYQYINNKNKINIPNPFGKLGIIDYKYEKENGINFDKQVSEALDWKIKLISDWKQMHLAPIDNDNLYPNMKNHYDKNYKKMKKNVAYENKEITLLWNCGIKNRKIAWDNGIKQYSDEKLTPELLGINNKSNKYDIVDKMLFINKQNNINYIVSKKNNYLDWQNNVEYEFYVDFETYSQEKIYDENSDNDFIQNLNSQIVYMIGVVYKNKLTSVQEFKCFIIEFSGHDLIKQLINKTHKCSHDSYIICKSEKELLNKFTDFILSFKDKQINLEDFYNKTRLIHWSQAEPIIFNKKLKEHNLTDFKYKLPWYDLLKVFKYGEEPIIIKDCFSFGLKDIVKNLNSHRQIDLVWPELDDGLLSSFIAKDIYAITNFKNKSGTNSYVFNMINIVEYNYIDCIAIYKLLDWMRNVKK